MVIQKCLPTIVVNGLLVVNPKKTASYEAVFCVNNFY